MYMAVSHSHTLIWPYAIHKHGIRSSMCSHITVIIQMWHWKEAEKCPRREWHRRCIFTMNYCWAHWLRKLALDGSESYINTP